MVSPRQGVSPRPNYSWRSRLMEPAGLSSGLAESARLPPSRASQGSTTPSMPGPMVPGAATPSLIRQNSAQRSFKPVLQKRNSREPVWQRARETPASRSTSADCRQQRAPPVRRTCRTLSPPDHNRIASRAAGPCGNFAPPLATPPMGKGTAIGGSGCPHRFRGAAVEQLPRVPPTSAPPSMAPPLVVPPSTDFDTLKAAAFDTPRSPSLKEECRSSPPSTVPQVLSGTPGSPGRETMPETPLAFEGFGGSIGVANGPSAPSTGPVITSQQLLTHDQNWKYRLENDRGVHADFVHVDEDELPMSMQAFRGAQPSAPSSGNVGNGCAGDVQYRGPLSRDCSNLLETSVDLQSSCPSFNLSPIKKTVAAGKCGDEAASRCLRPTSPPTGVNLGGVNVPPPELVGAPRRREEFDDQENMPPSGNTKSKVAAMRNLWEKRVVEGHRDRAGSAAPRERASSAAATSEGLGLEEGLHQWNAARGRSASREDQQRVRRASLSRIDPKMYRRLKKEEEEAKRQARCLDELFQRMELTGGETMSGALAELDSSISSSLSDCLEDSPTVDKFEVMFKSSRACWRRQQKVTKAVIDFLTSEAGRTARPCLGCVGKAEEVVASPIDRVEEAAATSPVASTFEEPALPELLRARPDLLQSLLLPPSDHVFKFTCDKVPDAVKSPPATPQPEEEADPRKSVVEDATTSRRKSGLEDARMVRRKSAMDNEMILPPKGKRLSAEEGSASWNHSTISDAEPAREPQPLGHSPRELAVELSSSSDTPLLDSPGGAKSSSLARASASGPEHEEGLTTEADSSMNSSALIGDEESANIDQSLDDALGDYTTIRPGEDGMERGVTMLHAIEQGELKRELYIMVPDGIGADRKVQFTFENKSHEVVVPEGYEVGAQVLVTISNRPFLERTANQGLRRGHCQPEFADRWSIIDNLRHSLRTDSDSSSLGADEFRNRYNLYMLLRGRCGAPLLPFTVEETAEDAMASPLRGR